MRAPGEVWEKGGCEREEHQEGTESVRWGSRWALDGVVDGTWMGETPTIARERSERPRRFAQSAIGPDVQVAWMGGGLAGVDRLIGDSRVDSQRRKPAFSLTVNGGGGVAAADSHPLTVNGRRVRFGLTVNGSADDSQREVWMDVVIKYRQLQRMPSRELVARMVAAGGRLLVEKDGRVLAELSVPKEGGEDEF